MSGNPVPAQLIINVSSLPAASAARTGKFYRIAGTPEELWQCVQFADGNYDWMQITQGGVAKP